MGADTAARTIVKEDIMDNHPYSLNNPGEEPAFVAPPLSCDAHFHVFGDKERYPFGVPKLRYEPPRVSMSDFLTIARRLGLERFVLVQPSCYGYDNSCQLDAVVEIGPEAARAVVDLDENAPDAELERLHRLGTRGVRINVNPIEPPTPGLSEKLLPRIKAIEARCRAIGWHLDFLFPDWLTAEFMPHFRALTVPYTIAHMGMNRGTNGVGAPGFQSLLDTLRDDPNCWVKLTAAYRISSEPDYADVVDMGQAVVETAPDRVLWGSDFPHVSFTAHSTVRLFDLLARYAPDEGVRNRILVDNPAAFYGF